MNGALPGGKPHTGLPGRVQARIGGSAVRLIAAAAPELENQPWKEHEPDE